MAAPDPGWFHPYLFMRWMGEMSLPQWFAAIGSFTASIVALRLAKGADARELGKEARALQNRRKVAAVALDEAGTVIGTIIKSLADHTTLDVQNFNRWAEMAREPVKLAMKQEIPDRDLLRLCFFATTLLNQIEDSARPFGGAQLSDSDQDELLKAWGKTLLDLKIKLEAASEQILSVT